MQSSINERLIRKKEGKSTQKRRSRGSIRGARKEERIERLRTPLILKQNT
jgi:hypothetical protein